MFIEIEKWHGAKNDFIVTWILTTDRDMLVPTLERLAPKLCTRDGSGMAADGILVLVAKSSKSPHPEELVIINSDGSQAKNCGNGLRCAAMSARKRALKEGVSDFDGVTLTVQGLPIDCRFLGKEGTPFVAVTMPAPVINADNSWHREIEEVVKSHQKLNSLLLGDVETVSLGNPHVVLTVNQASLELAAGLGPPLQKSRGGDGINVHVTSAIEITEKDRQQARREIGEEIGELFLAFPWERGVGPTQACGTGACAVGATILATGLSERALWVAIDMPGGRLYVKQAGKDDLITLAGPAKFVFTASVEI
jgi:diaminopimelate epimerase